MVSISCFLSLWTSLVLWLDEEDDSYNTGEPNVFIYLPLGEKIES